VKMNNLCRVIEPGEEVVISKSAHFGMFQELDERIFVVEGGPGMHPFAAGSRLTGHYKSDGEEMVARGWDIDVAETIEHQKGT